MGNIDRAKALIERITSDLNGFGVAITLTAPDGTVLDIVGLHTKHHLDVDMDTGKRINTKNAHVSFSEKFLIDAAYPVRVNGEVFLRGHKVSVKDSTDLVCHYLVDNWFPNATTGLIVCTLKSFE